MSKSTLVVKRDGTKEEFNISKLRRTLDWGAEMIGGFSASELELEIDMHIKDGIKTTDIMEELKLSAQRKTSQDEPEWSRVAGAFAMMDLHKAVKYNVKKTFKLNIEDKLGYHFTLQKLPMMITKGYYIDFFSHYTKEELDEAVSWIDLGLDKSYEYITMASLEKQYLIKNNFGVIELPQEAHLFNALANAINENPTNKMKHAFDLYSSSSLHEISLATPVFANSRKPNSSSTSCEVVSFGDSLDLISHTMTMIKKDTARGTGFGAYFGKVRCSGSAIQGKWGVAGGVIPYIKELNDIIVATSQLGSRDGNVAVTLDIWHYDYPSFLELKVETGDQRMRAYDIFRAVSIPDLFMERMLSGKDWTLIDPYEAKLLLGKDLCDFYGAEFVEKYEWLEQQPLKIRKTIPAKELWMETIKIIPEAGDPFHFYRDAVNINHSNSHCGVIYASNLCHEIVSFFTEEKEEIMTYDYGTNTITTSREAGYASTCNLLSINLGKLYKEEDLIRVAKLSARTLDNVVSLTNNANPSATRFNTDFRSIGIGFIGYAHHLAKKGLKYGSPEAIEYTDEFLMKIIATAVLEEECNMADERGAYPKFDGSKWNTRHSQYEGILPDSLLNRVSKGIRNGYIFAIAPNTSTSGRMAETASIYPISDYLVEKEGKSGSIVTPMPELQELRWYYVTKPRISPEEYLNTVAIFQKWVDQSISTELPYGSILKSPKELHRFYVEGWKKKFKTMYYSRPQSVRCSACAN